jgi:enoyl-CoA hydratase/carnithine racemase
MEPEILLSVDDGVGVITLNRPATLNTFTGSMMSALGEAYRQFDADDAVLAVVVTGTGKAFCAGADMGSGPATFAPENTADISSCPLSFQAWEVRKPVIAACNGHAIGVGLGIALQCDMRVLAAEGKYGLLQNRRGVVADFAVEQVLPRLVGFERAFELIVRAPRLSGAEAVQWGLASRVVPAHQVLPCAMEIARDMARNCSPLVMALHKRLLWCAQEMGRDEFIALESKALRLSMAGPDAVEGGAAYVQRRVPQWASSVSADWPDWW